MLKEEFCDGEGSWWVCRCSWPSSGGHRMDLICGAPGMWRTGGTGACSSCWALRSCTTASFCTATGAVSFAVLSCSAVFPVSLMHGTAPFPRHDPALEEIHIISCVRHFSMERMSDT